MASRELENQDLQSYLDSFNKEIEDGDTNAITLTEEQVVAISGGDKLTECILQNVKAESAAATTNPKTYYIEHGNKTLQQWKTSSPFKQVKKVRPNRTLAIAVANTSEENSVPSTPYKEFIRITPNNKHNTSSDTAFLNVSNVKSLYEFESSSGLEDDEDATLDFNNEETESINVKSGTLKSQLLNGNGKTQVYSCSMCQYVSTKRRLLTRHLQSHSDDRPFKCSVCERGFKKNSALLNHVNTHLGNKPHHCKFCSSTFTTSGELVRHVRYRHTGEKPHKCTECNYASVELSKLRRHLRCHTGERPYQCPHCTYASPDSFKLKRHLRTHTGEKPYECDICNARFSQSNSLKAHKLIHSVGDKPVFQCELCPTTCGRKTDLRLHMNKLHNPDHPVVCQRCNKECPDRYSYKVHNKTHKGEKCYRCKICAYASVSQRHLESHMLVHSDEKPFVCCECNTTFRQPQLLKRHMNVYHNKSYVKPTPREKAHACPDCERTFTHKGNLMRHMQTHDPDFNNVKLEYGKSVENLNVINLPDQEFDTVSFSADELFEVNGAEIIVKGKRLNEDNTEHHSLFETYEVFESYSGNNNNNKNAMITNDNMLLQTSPITFSIKKERFVDQTQEQQQQQQQQLRQRQQKQQPIAEIVNCGNEHYMVLEVIPSDDDDIKQSELRNLLSPQQLASNDSTLLHASMPSPELNATITPSTTRPRKYQTLENCFGFEDEEENVDATEDDGIDYDVKTESEMIDLNESEQNDDIYSIGSDSKDKLQLMDILDED